MPRGRKHRSLSFLLGLVALGWLAVCAIRRRRLGRTIPLALAQAAHARWVARPDDPGVSKNLYRSVARLLEWFDALPAERRTESARNAGLAVEVDPLEESDLCRFTVADKIPAHRLLRCHLRAGIGVPVVAWRANDGSDRWDVFRPPEGIAAPATAVLEPEANDRWTLRLLSPYRRDTVAAEGHTYPLAANFSAPIAKIARQAEPLRRSGFRGMLNSAAIPRREKLYLIQRYDPNRIPLLMVHGLQSTPVSFANLVNDLCADPVLHARYQIWHYHYPTGTPVLQNAAVLRRVLKQALGEIDPRGGDFATNNLVVLGHSMGGIMTHTLISDSGYNLWDKVISVRPETFSCDPKTSRVVECDLPVRARNPRPPRHPDRCAAPRQSDCRQLARRPRPAPLPGGQRIAGSFSVPRGKSSRSDQPLYHSTGEGRKTEFDSHALRQQPCAHGLGGDSARRSVSQHYRPVKLRPGALG